MLAQSNPLRRRRSTRSCLQAKGGRSCLHTRGPIRFEILAIISICGLLFVVAFREAGHPLWAIPAMTLFLLSGMMFVYALSKASRRLLQGPQETTLAVP